MFMGVVAKSLLQAYQTGQVLIAISARSACRRLMSTSFQWRAEAISLVRLKAELAKIGRFFAKGSLWDAEFSLAWRRRRLPMRLQYSFAWSGVNCGQLATARPEGIVMLRST